VAVGRWGRAGDASQEERFLRAAGAEHVGWSLRETAGHLCAGAPTPGKSGDRDAAHGPERDPDLERSGQADR
jgi:hypothetical protein